MVVATEVSFFQNLERNKRKHFYNSAQICELSLDVGWECETAPSTELFYFDNADNICKSFIYLGCGGNLNRFGNPQNCEAFCPSGDPATNTTGLSRPSNSGTIDDGGEVGFAGDIFWSSHQYLEDFKRTLRLDVKKYPDTEVVLV